MAGKKTQLVQRFARPGEGVIVGHIDQEISRSHGGQAVAIDLSTAPVPDRRYAAEVGAIVLSNNLVRLLFGQTNPIAGGLTSLLVIHVSYRGARSFVSSLSKGLAKNAREFMDHHNIAVSHLFEIKDQKEPIQTATVEANLIAAAFSGREACLDFYHASSFALHGFGVTGKFVAEPTVRVTLTLPLMMAMYDWLTLHKSELPADELEDKL